MHQNQLMTWLESAATTRHCGVWGLGCQSHVVSFECDDFGAGDESVEDGFGDDGVGDGLVPLIWCELGCHDCGSSVLSLSKDGQQLMRGCGIDWGGEEIIQHEHIRGVEFLEELHPLNVTVFEHC